MTAAPAELGLRERKKIKTRRMLRDAAVRLADERGYDAVTVDDIAEAAEVSTRTFFNYFTSKEDAIVGIDQEEIQETVSALANRPPDESPVAALRAVMVAQSIDTALHRDQLQAKIRVIRANPVLIGAFHASWSRYEAALVDIVAQRCGLDSDMDAYPSVVVSAALAVSRTMSLRWRDHPGDSSLPDLVSAAFDNLAAGLTPPAAGEPPPRRAFPS
ncbi:TetR/AcrR family transcriptional regulator [Frankia sp. Cr2]|uniref:TetR/AcrR family transcriptional regulator n=1 Tax=Frankia sp. Cr2 TaxID=3073932 RepID=UPI002AD2BCD3|nr:TetR/AcrR family transcriptional regulator [Frankia sp. Cr2]